MTKRQRDKLNRLCRDLPALARHLALPADPMWQREQATLDAAEAQAEGMTPKDRERWIAANERNRWRVAEAMLWLAAWGEQDARRDADIAAGKIREVRASVGLSWQPAPRLVRKTVEMKWEIRLSDLFDHEAVRAGMPADLHAIIRKLLLAFLAERKEAEELRANPTPASVEAWKKRNEDEGVPDAAAGIVTEFQEFITKTEKQGVSDHQRAKKLGKGAKDVPGGHSATAEAQETHMRTLRKRYPNDRAEAIKQFCTWQEFGDGGCTAQHARTVARRIGWGRQKKGITG